MIFLQYILAIIIYTISCSIITNLLDLFDKFVLNLLFKRERLGTAFSSNLSGNFIGSLLALVLTKYFFNEKLTLYIALPIFGLIWIYTISQNLELAAWSTFIAMIIGLALSYYFLSQPQFNWN